MLHQGDELLLCLLTNAGRGFASSYWNSFQKASIAYGARCQQKEKGPLGIDVCITREAKKAAACLVEPAWDAVLACKGSLQTKITILSCNEMLIQLLLSQLLSSWLKITAWVQVSPGQPAPLGEKGDDSAWWVRAAPDIRKANHGKCNTLMSAGRNDCSVIYSNIQQNGWIALWNFGRSTCISHSSELALLLYVLPMNWVSLVCSLELKVTILLRTWEKMHS